MEPTFNLVSRDPTARFAVTTAQSHPQLRDLITCSAAPSSALFTTPDSNTLCSYSSESSKVETTEHFLDYTPTAIAYGCSLLACVGGAGQVTILPADGIKRGTWMQSQHYVTSLGDIPNINNSVFIAPPLASSSNTTPRLYVSSNDSTVKIFDIVGHIPDYVRSGKRRLKERYAGRRLRRDDRDHAMDRDEEDTEPQGETGDEEEEDDVEETGVHDTGGACSLTPVSELSFPTPINHSSISPSGRLMCSVGDTSEVFIHSISADGQTYQLLSTFTNHGSGEGSFSTDWSRNSLNVAVGSQDGHVYVYDVRYIPTKDAMERDWNNEKEVAKISSSQSGPSGAVRKVKFSTTSDLLAFAEHRSIVQVVDTRTFERSQILEIPFSDTARHARTQSAPNMRPIAGRMNAQFVPIPRSLLSSGTQAAVRGLSHRNEMLTRSGGSDRVPRQVPISSLLEMIGRSGIPGDGAGIGGAWERSQQTTYHATSINFPTEDSTREDILGLDFDIFSEKLFIATNDIVYEYTVNDTGRRCFDTYEFS